MPPTGRGGHMFRTRPFARCLMWLAGCAGLASQALALGGDSPTDLDRTDRLNWYTCYSGDPWADAYHYEIVISRGLSLVDVEATVHRLSYAGERTLVRHLPVAARSVGNADLLGYVFTGEAFWLETKLWLDL